jgi:hypothetical protein
MADPAALAGKHQIRPLPFNPSRLKGLSERLIVSHHENNYGGAGVGTFWWGNHTHACAFGQPLRVLDMYEHSYALDYGAAGKYVDALFQNVNWEDVDRRLERAEKMARIHASDRTGDAP